ncbi:MAG TPA: isoleucine--tRNA ligase [Thermoplasmata archaeon]|nr:isoleucine--tRNA ligase [Thermoplasmata archaeon]
MAPDDEAAGAPSPAEVQRRVLQYWDTMGVPERAYYGRPDGPVFRFTEGPPGVNGPPHLGHVEPGTLKDTLLRYRRMRGDRIVTAKGGWDCHGLPVEIAIEKRHGLKSRKEIEAFGVDRFCAECREAALEYAGVWTEMGRRQGNWLDYGHAYRTMDAPYIESVWWALKSLFDRGLLEKGHYVLPYCPRCETTLSSHEVAQGYHETTDPSVTVRFPLVGAERDLLVWTTTPWTLPANLFVVAHPDLEYSVVRTGTGRDVVLASEAIPRYFSGPVEIVERFAGRALADQRYEPPFDAAGPGDGRYRVVLDRFVTAGEGTGFVHGAPSFGPDDYRIGLREKVGVFDPLDNRAVFGDAVPLVRGKTFKNADPILLHDLAERGRIFRSETLRHTYPYCWRCEHALLYRAIDSWFLRTSRITDALVRNNRATTWIPAYLRDGRFGNFLTEAKDWALSRSRYWGTPLPVWVCAAGHATCVGSFAELAERSGTPIPEGFDPHRVTVDRIELKCATCEGAARREPYTLDVWFDSGSAPFAEFHYPFEDGPFDPAAPLDVVAEAIDQTRGWFYTLLVIATALFDRPAFRASVTSEFLLEETGRKMSKSKGKVLEPLEILDRYGGDAIRWLFLSQDFTAPIRVGETTLEKSGHRTLGALRNVVAFHTENARADHLPPETEPPQPTAALDRWLLSRLEGTRAAATEALERFDPRPAAGAVRDFVDDLSTWYLRRSRPRFWSAADAPERRTAHATLSYALLEIARIAAPLVPFTAEWVRQEVGETHFGRAEESVHLAAWPLRSAARDLSLETGMATVRELVEIGRELRQRAEVKSRIPLAELVLFGPATPELASLGAEGTALLADELNVKRVVRVPAEDAARYPDTAWVVREDRGVPIAALPRTPSPELLEEGLAREVARRLQQARKELGLRYLDAVGVVVSAPEPLARALRARRDGLARDLLATPFEITDRPLEPGPEVRSWELDGLAFSARIVRAEAPPGAG